MRRLPFIATFCALPALLPVWGQMRAAPRMAAPMARPAFVSRAPAFAGGRVAFGHNPRFQVFFNQNPFFFNRFHRRFFFFDQPFFFPVVYGGYSYPIVIQTAPPANYARDDYEERREMAREIERLSDEVERLREEQASRAAARPAAKPETEMPRPATVLVFKDKHIREVQNYAIVGQTLWLFNEQRATKIPLSSVDMDATMKLNDERGIEFRTPEAPKKN